MTSTGLGEIHAVTVAEQVFSIVVMFLGISVLFGMLLGGITSMLTNFDEQRGLYAHRFRVIKTHLVRSTPSPSHSLFIIPPTWPLG